MIVEPENNKQKEALQQMRSGELELLGAQELLTWAVKKFAPKIALSSSFGGMSGMVIIDMLQQVAPETPVIVLDTGRLPQETYDLIDRVRDRYDLPIDVQFPDAEAVQGLVRDCGMNGFYESVENRQRCCQVRKVDPMNKALAGLDAWMTGLRRDQSSTRNEVRKVEIDEAHGGIIKLNPLVDWTHDQILEYVEKNQVPTNRLHRHGYPSVGCAPCTRAIGPGDDIRAGRWWWENPDTKECGIHVGAQFDGSGI
jgi:phosphoadenosine phosphosulfate reductase